LGCAQVQVQMQMQAQKRWQPLCFCLARMLWLVCIEQNPATTRNKGGCKLLKQAQEGEGVLRRREGERGLSQADRANALCSSPSTPASFLSLSFLPFFSSSLPHPLLFPFWEVVFVEKLQRFRTNRPQEQKEAEAITIQLLSSTFLSCFSIFLSSSPLPPFFIHSPFCLPDCPQERRLNNVGQAEKSLCFHVPALVIAMCSPFAHTPHFTVTLTCVCNQLLVFAASIGTNTKNERTEEAP